MMKSETIQGWRKEVKRTKLDPGDWRETVQVGHNETSFDVVMGLDIWSVTDTTHIVCVRNGHNDDHGWWTWEGCSADDVVTHSRSMYGDNPWHGWEE